MEHLLTPDELEETITHNFQELERVRAKPNNEELERLFEHRMNSALDELSDFYAIARNTGEVALQHVRTT